LKPLYLIYPYLETGAGDLFSVTWSSSLQTIFIGCQNTSLQWYSFQDPIKQVQSSTKDDLPLNAPVSSSVVSRKAHKFFDSYPQYERRPADIYAKNNTLSRTTGRGSPDSDFADISQPKEYCSILSSNVIDSAHYGYIYCMALLTETNQPDKIVTGSGDETVKVG
jgi:di- and tripeptidase